MVSILGSLLVQTGLGLSASYRGLGFGDSGFKHARVAGSGILITGCMDSGSCGGFKKCYDVLRAYVRVPTEASVPAMAFAARRFQDVVLVAGVYS